MQQQNKIQNPEQQIDKGPEMNDRDFINDILATEKWLGNGYSIAQNEASHRALNTDIQNLYTETHQCQQDLYQLMFRKGWYGLEQVDQNKVQEVHSQFTGYTNQFPHR
ncbi:MAG: Coat domain protein [Bacillales bacterium]|jgi:spore coat protein CotF|nr:Coat domain protein [Bacillales bacterium]